MNIEFEEFSTEEEMLEFIKCEVPSNNFEVFTARVHKRTSEYYVFYDEYDLKNWFEEHLTSGPFGCYESELVNWGFKRYSYWEDSHEIESRKVTLSIDYSLDIGVSY